MQWQNALGAAAIVNILTLLGVVLLGVPAIRSVTPGSGKQTVTLASGFAGGALLSASFFLMAPESFELALHEDEHDADHDEGHQDEEHHDDHDDHRRRALAEHDHHDEEEHHDEEKHGEHDEHGETWQWSTLLLAGFCITPVLDLLIAHLKVPAKQLDKDADYSTDAEKAKSADVVAPALSADELASIRRLTLATLVGDAMHNFADGTFIGTAFLSCSPAVGWAVVVGTVAHEIAQELADFLVLTQMCGLRTPVALIANFASGMLVFIGVIVVLAADLSSRSVGFILAFGAGIFIYNAAVECVPRLLRETVANVKAAGMALFVIGAVAIGVVLISHEHCE